MNLKLVAKYLFIKILLIKIFQINKLYLKNKNFYNFINYLLIFNLIFIRVLNKYFNNLSNFCYF